MILGVLALSLLPAACGGDEPLPTATPTKTAIPVATNTPVACDALPRPRRPDTVADGHARRRRKVRRSDRANAGGVPVNRGRRQHVKDGTDCGKIGMVTQADNLGVYGKAPTAGGTRSAVSAAAGVDRQPVCQTERRHGCRSLARRR